MNILFEEYNAFPPGYAGGYSQLRLDYRTYFVDLLDRVDHREAPLRTYIVNAFPNTFLYEHGVNNILELRETYLAYAREKLQPIDAQYGQGVEQLITSLAPDAGIGEREATTASREITRELSSWRDTTAPLEEWDLDQLQPDIRSVLEKLDALRT
ncbi:MAG: hypothetical protein HY556_12300 [Euryarchaeota archaeon]|nr:hypothetical protein [Euryarchaeota archaeon]